ncbi:PDF receptor-like [Haliotis rufescens]|uniref:PDF receptor-like n=1 Tax=Haliotis rufescens TaxID=6454 RepID=UPI001EB08CB8|nr:PDF receptor-like [Haliotis rufescens]
MEGMNKRISDGLKKATEECLKSIKHLYPKSFCNASFDGYICWPPTLPGMTISRPCPSVDGFTSTGQAYKRCNRNGTWYSPPGNELSVWTNYTTCVMPDEQEETTPYIPTAAVQEVSIDVTVLTNDLLFYFLNCIAALALIIAIIIFGCCIKKWSLRYQILIPLFLSALLISLVSLTFNVMQYVDDPTQSDRSLSENPTSCITITYLRRFSELATYSWLMVLGINYMIWLRKCNLNRGRLLLSFFLGFGLPVMLASAWVVAVTFFLRSNLACVLYYQLDTTHWITDAPKFLIIAIALLMFFLCMWWATCRPLVAYECTEIRLVLQSVWKVVLLLLLLAAAEVYLTLCAYGIVESVSIAETIVKGIRPLLIAVMLCFLDTETWCCCYY